ncbi:MAG: ABC transporter ATP-binding protein [Bacillota bacterium]
MLAPLLEVYDLKKHFVVKGSKEDRKAYALNGISFTVNEGETFGLVGESGCGKTTAGRVITCLTKPTAGKVIFDGKDMFSLSKKELKKTRRHLQMIFQDPFASLDPRMTVGNIISEPLVIHGIGDKKSRRKSAEEFLEVVGLQSSYYNRYPHEFSGGQRQRIGIARALILHPKLVICDEPVSALDVSVQSQILNLLSELQDTLGLTYIFIAHGLNVVKHVSNRIGVMYLGKMVEIINADELFKSAAHPYTQALLSAVPVPDPNANKQRIILEGDIPSPFNPPSGCFFHTRCKYCKDICRKEQPPTRQWGDRMVVCHFPLI